MYASTNTSMSSCCLQAGCVHEGEQALQWRQLLGAARRADARRRRLHQNNVTTRTSAAAILSRKLLSLQNNDRFYSSFIISFTDDGAAPRSDGRVEGLDAARHPRLSHHRRQQGTEWCHVTGQQGRGLLWHMTCAFIKLVFVSGSSDLQPDPRARLVLSLPLRIRTFPLLLQ